MITAHVQSAAPTDPHAVDGVGDQQAVAALAKALVEGIFKDTRLKLVQVGQNHIPIMGVLRVATNAQDPLAPVE